MNVGEKVRDEVMGAWEGLEVEWLCNKIWSILGRVSAKWDTHQISHQHSIENIVELDTANYLAKDKLMGAHYTKSWNLKCSHQNLEKGEGKQHPTVMELYYIMKSSFFCIYIYIF